MQQNNWPDHLTTVAPERVQSLLEEFWHTLRILPDLLDRQENLLADENTAHLRAIVIEMMLALNGIQRPPETRHLNTYLSAKQRQTIEKTLVTPNISGDVWIGRAVALVIIYSWYAPQLVEKLRLRYPQRTEEDTWSELVTRLPAWPKQVFSN